MTRTTSGGGGATGLHAQGNAARHVVDDLHAEGEWAAHTVKRPPRPRQRGNDTTRHTGRSGRQNAVTQRNMRREERVTVQGPVKKQRPEECHAGGLAPNSPSDRLGVAVFSMRIGLHILSLRTACVNARGFTQRTTHIRCPEGAGSRAAERHDRRGHRVHQSAVAERRVHVFGEWVRHADWHGAEHRVRRCALGRVCRPLLLRGHRDPPPPPPRSIVLVAREGPDERPLPQHKPPQQRGPPNAPVLRALGRDHCR